MPVLYKKQKFQLGGFFGINLLGSSSGSETQKGKAISTTSTSSGELAGLNKLHPNYISKQKLIDAYRNKISSIPDIDYHPIVNDVREYEKTNYGKDSDDIKHVRAPGSRFDLVPVHSKIKNDIFKAADETGVDRYEALALGIIESNAGTSNESDRASGEGMFTNHSGSGYSSPYIETLNSTEPAILKNFGTYLNNNKIVSKYKYDPDTKFTIPDVEKIDPQVMDKATNDYINTINKEKGVSNSLGQGLLYYKMYPLRYNGGAAYVQTVKNLANKLREQGF